MITAIYCVCMRHLQSMHGALTIAVAELDEAGLEGKRNQAKDDMAAVVEDMIAKSVSLDATDALGATPVLYAACRESTWRETVLLLFL